MNTPSKTILFVNKQNDPDAFMAFFYCGYMNTYRENGFGFDCAPNAKGEKSKDDIITIFSESTNVEILTTCGELSSYKSSSIEYKKLDFIC